MKIDKRLLTSIVLISFLLLFPTNIYHFFDKISSINNKRGSFPYQVNHYIYPEEHEALEWLKANSKEYSVVLSTYNIGNYIPRYMNNRVYLGHWAQTINFTEKSEDVIEFYQGKSDSIDLENIDYIWYGLDEKEVNENFIPPENSKIVFENEKVSVYNIT
ncbi:hypothetical protein GF327_04605 [Candidatus Woesearchaeota archaeon]|nr:hypothetical protein [Candidatus Woesearchaeota archaeon]